MILDSSAILAILQGEPEAAAFNRAIVRAPSVAVSAATVVEAGIVAEARATRPVGDRLDRLLAGARAEIVPFTADHAALALEGWRRFGKGRHPARLNLGDCFAYALARARGEPLLFKGDDLARTDVRRAV